ncbi:CpXC domain-containing protein [Promineifilum sp.]|uniref:CpXC domain-containing protein n=1 Tax=Promineifilum sp. TaxID=2664178 RepID=UPI0035AE0E92
MHSHAEPATLPCRHCGAPFTADVWVIVDTDERPDLLILLRAGTLHDLRCPACGHTATINAPLLVYRPGAEPALLFSPARGDERERDEEQAAALVGMLHDHLGATWREEWLARGLAGAAREALPLLLGEDPATAAALAAAAGPAGAEDEVPPAVREALAGAVAALAAEGVRLNTAEDLRRALEERPELKARVAAALRGL